VPWGAMEIDHGERGGEREGGRAHGDREVDLAGGTFLKSVIRRVVIVRERDRH
jgi:hypothetical protein